MERKKLQSVSIAALIVSILPLAALAPSFLHLSLSDRVRTAWAGANIVFVLLSLILSDAVGSCTSHYLDGLHIKGQAAYYSGIGR